MAFNDTLFQLGMDLTRSSTAQKEDLVGSAPDAQEDCYSSSSVESRLSDRGRHLLIDLTGAKRCETAKSAEKALRQALESAQCRVRSVAARRTEKGRCISASASIEGGEVKAEAWPETGYVAVDVYGAAALRPELAMSLLMDAFGAREAMIKRSRTAAEVARLSRPMRWLGLPFSEKPAAARSPERTARARRAA